MPELKVRKVLSNVNDGFSDTLKFKVLHCGNVEGNNNKFYCLEIQKNSKSEYRLFSHYGRLGKTNIYEVRDTYEGQKVTDLSMAEKEFEVIIKKKLKGKKIKDEDTGEERIERYVEVETIKPNVGSENICNKTITTVTSTAKVAKVDTAGFDKEVARIINQIVEENIHNIKTMTTFTLSAGGFETPLGPVTQQHIEKAKQPLNSMKALLKSGKLDTKNKTVIECNNAYFSMIPHPFGHKILETDWISDEAKLATEFDLLDQLSASVTMGSSLNQGAQQRFNSLGSDVEVLKDSGDYKRIQKYIEESKAGNHRGSDIWSYRIKNIYRIRIPDERKRFDLRGKPLGSIKELFHGTKNCNVLSILKGGLIIPSCNAPTVSGRMFGDGCYFAHNSTKSLNYSTNFWNSNYRNKYDNIFLFLADVAMGKAYEIFNSLYSGTPRGYNSIHAKKGPALHNDEYIVPELFQCTLTYLVELVK
jgi:poly [ADP-ribose] polymerase